MENLNTQVSTETIDGIVSAIENGMKIDPHTVSFVKALSEACGVVEDLKEAEKAAAESEEAEILVKRVPFEFNSSEFEESMQWLIDNIETIIDITSKKREVRVIERAKFLNALSYVSDSIICTGVGNIEPITTGVDLPTAIDYFRDISINKSFKETFIDPYDAVVKMAPMINGSDGALEVISQPVLEISKGEITIALTLSPCNYHTPMWYTFITEMYKSVVKYMEDSLIEMESEALGVNDIFEQ